MDVEEANNMDVDAGSGVLFVQLHQSSHHPTSDI
jgi:hypothetical protein